MAQDRRKIWTITVAVIGAAALWAVIGLWQDYWCDLNDDALILRILNGSYTGAPESMDIQNLYPLSALLSILYKAVRSVPWYQALLLVCQFGSMALIAYRVLCACGKRAAALMGGLLLSLMLWHLVFVQYSVAVGFLCTAAAVWILTVPQGTFRFRALWPAWALLWLAYVLRSEMMLFMGPFVLLAFLYRAMQEREGIRKILVRCLCAGAVLVVGIGLLEGADRAARRSPDWQEFTALFDARTQLYDFQTIPPYEDNQSFYDSIGMSGEEAELLVNYNYGLDPDMNAQKMQQVADYAAQLRIRDKSVKERIKDALWDYRQEFTARAELPYNSVSICLYVLCLIMAAGESVTARRRRSGRRSAMLDLLYVCGLFGARSVLFLYLFYHQRPVARLTHCIYLAECAALLFLLVKEVHERKGFTRIYAGVCIAAFAAALIVNVQSVNAESERREETNIPCEDLYDYEREHPDIFFLTDVYSTVSFTDRMFGEAAPLNQDVLGGWACKSPLQEKKLMLFGISSMEEALTQENVRFVSRTDYDTGWLTAYYRSKGVNITLITETVIDEDLTVYKVNRN
ncbi:MAG: hypothetical protein PUC46_00275 [Lachnospiraceae bacterium]|nr:hypothetical protein [Lachnospiraceae bacterium]